MTRSHNRKKLDRFYWDSNVWISQIQNETSVRLKDGTVENRVLLGRPIIQNAERGQAEIVTSTLSLVEVIKPSRQDSAGLDTNRKIEAFFENDYIVLVQLNREVVTKARELMQSGHAGLKPPDALHIASAIIANADEMHAFDGSVLDLNGKLERADGKKLIICKPSLGGPSLPLLELTEDEINHEGEGNETD